MKLIFRHTLLVLILFTSISSRLCAQDLYDPQQVSELEINFYDSNWDAILDAPISMPHNFYLYNDPSDRFNNIQLSLTAMQQLDPNS